MAFNRKNMGGNVGAGSDTAKLYVYKTADSKATVVASGYFNDGKDVLKVGDIIMATHDTGGTVKTAFLTVATNNGTVVTVAFGLVA
jgi:hypothetical protein